MAEIPGMGGDSDGGGLLERAIEVQTTLGRAFLAKLRESRSPAAARAGRSRPALSPPKRLSPCRLRENAANGDPNRSMRSEGSLILQRHVQGRPIATSGPCRDPRMSHGAICYHAKVRAPKPTGRAIGGKMCRIARLSNAGGL